MTVFSRILLWWRTKRLLRITRKHPVPIPKENISGFELDDLLLTYVGTHVDQRFVEYIKILRESTVDLLLAAGYRAEERTSYVEVRSDVQIVQPDFKTPKPSEEPWIGFTSKQS